MPPAAAAPPATDGADNSPPQDASAAAALTAAAALGSPTPLDRERAARSLPGALAAIVPPARPAALAALEAASATASTSPSWQARWGGLVADRAVLQTASSGGGATTTTPLPPAVARAVGALDDPEPRVRLAAADVLGAAAMAAAGSGDPLAVWTAARPTLLRLIARDWDRDAAATAGAEGDALPADAPPSLPHTTGALPPAATASEQGDGTLSVASILASSYAPQPPGAGEMRHGTEGWRCLETAVRALLAVMDGCGPAFAAAAPPGGEVEALLTRAALHPNRFVREAAYGALGGLAALAGPDADGDPASAAFITATAARLGTDGLAENWSQVRLAACVAARALLLGCPPPPSPTRAAALASLLPALALNRYDAAEGVASYSQATWAAVMGRGGPSAVAAHAPAVVAHYLKAAKTNNHQSREAAAVCCGELCTKVERAAVRPHAPALLTSLLLASKDDAWPVREAAGAALAHLVAAFPDALSGRPPAVAGAWAAWAGALDDNVPSVRSSAAGALVQGACALDWAGVGLPAGGLPAVSAAGKGGGGGGGGWAAGPPDHPAIAAAGGPATFLGAAADLALAALARTADQPTGGSVHPPPRGLAPPPPPGAPPSAAALFKGGAGAGLLRPRRDTGGIDFSCGCMDYSYKRAREAWEAADGGVRLVGALGEAGGGGSGGSAPAAAAAVALLPALAAAASASHFASHWALRETYAHAVAAVLAGAGPRAVKPHLEALLPPLLVALGPLGADRPLARAAAGRAVAALRDGVGPRIFAGRLSEGDRALVETSPDVPPPGGRFCVGGGSWVGGGGGGPIGLGAPTRAPWAGGGAPTPSATPTPPGPGLRPEGYAPGGFPMRHT